MIRLRVAPGREKHVRDGQYLLASVDTDEHGVQSLRFDLLTSGDWGRNALHTQSRPLGSTWREPNWPYALRHRETHYDEAGRIHALVVECS